MTKTNEPSECQIKRLIQGKNKSLAEALIKIEVADLLKKHRGGRAFFTAMDESLRGRHHMEQHLERVVISNFLKEHPKAGVIFTGRFGLCLVNKRTSLLLKGVKRKFWYPLLLVNGGLKQGQILDLHNYVYPGWEYLLIDDTYFSGRTRHAIKAEVERHGGKILKTYVLYDGSKIKHPEVDSLFRYYDHYKPGNIPIRRKR
jgi:hypothetical protein